MDGRRMSRQTGEPYHRWLGISPKHQPPDFYRLLGVERFEDDEEVLRDAAEQRTRHVRSYDLGEHREVARKILNELGRARAVLLEKSKRAAYDNELRVGERVEAALTQAVFFPDVT